MLYTATLSVRVFLSLGKCLRIYDICNGRPDDVVSRSILDDAFGSIKGNRSSMEPRLHTANSSQDTSLGLKQ